MQDQSTAVDFFDSRGGNSRLISRATTARGGKMRYEISLFKNKFDNLPNLCTWRAEDLTKQLSTPVIRATKDGPLFSPAKFNGKRANQNVLEVSLLVFDIDHNTEFGTIVRQLDYLGSRYLIHSTHSHLRTTESNPKGEPRYRVVLPLYDPISAELYPILWRHLKMTSELAIDEAAKDASRMYYLPSIVSQEAPFDFYENGDQPLNWKQLSGTSIRSKGGPTTNSFTELEIPQSRRNSELFKKAKQLYQMGLEQNEVFPALQSINTSRCKPSLTPDEIERTAQNAEKYPRGTAAAVRQEKLSVVRLSDVEVKTVDWLWEPLIPKGFFTLCDGVEGIGKTYLMLKIAASITTGDSFPECSNETELGDVLLLSAEDSASYILKPRLVAMEADCGRIFVLDGRFTLDETGFGQLSSILAEHRFKFILIDPLFSFTGHVNLNVDSEIRTITDRLNRIAEEYQCAIVGVRHINKSKGFGDPRNAGLNGVGWRAGSRSHLIVGHHPDDKTIRAIAQTKSNLTAETGKSFGYSIGEDGTFCWTGESDLTPELMLSLKSAGFSKGPGPRQQAKEFLADRLAEGPVAALELLRDAEGAGISESTLKRAKDEMGIKSGKGGAFRSNWIWELSNSVPKSVTEGIQKARIGVLRGNGAK